RSSCPLSSPAARYTTLFRSVRLALVGRRIALPFVVAYRIYALVYLSSANAKSDRVRAYYASLHPLLRVGLSTLIVSPTRSNGWRDRKSTRLNSSHQIISYAV